MRWVLPICACPLYNLAPRVDGAERWKAPATDWLIQVFCFCLQKCLKRLCCCWNIMNLTSLYQAINKVRLKTSKTSTYANLRLFRANPKKQTLLTRLILDIFSIYGTFGTYYWPMRHRVGRLSVRKLLGISVKTVYWLSTSEESERKPLRLTPTVCCLRANSVYNGMYQFMPRQQWRSLHSLTYCLSNEQTNRLLYQNTRK